MDELKWSEKNIWSKYHKKILIHEPEWFVISIKDKNIYCTDKIIYKQEGTCIFLLKFTLFEFKYIY